MPRRKELSPFLYFLASCNGTCSNMMYIIFEFGYKLSSKLPIEAIGLLFLIVFVYNFYSLDGEKEKYTHLHYLVLFISSILFTLSIYANALLDDGIISTLLGFLCYAIFKYLMEELKKTLDIGYDGIAKSKRVIKKYIYKKVNHLIS